MAKKNIKNAVTVTYNVGKAFSHDKFVAAVKAADMVGFNVEVVYDHGFDVEGDVRFLFEKGKRRVAYQVMIGKTDLDLMALAGVIKPTTALWLSQKAEKLAENIEDIIFGEE